jgi:sorbitol-specific phosphotransferase system component IIC
VWLGILVGIVVAPSSFLFPVAVSYVAYGVLRFFFLSLLDRPDRLALQGTAGEQEEGSPR